MIDLENFPPNQRLIPVSRVVEKQPDGISDHWNNLKMKEIAIVVIKTFMQVIL